MANAFYRRLDDCFARLHALGAVIALTADHGMNDKSLPNGEPNVVFLQDILDARFGAGTTRVVCPITDAFVRHHGALGGFVRIWCTDPAVSAAAVIEHIAHLPGIAEALDRDTVFERYRLPPDREGDVAVIAQTHVVIGGAAADHDLSALKGERLRSHGGTSEARVPFVLSAPMTLPAQGLMPLPAQASVAVFDVPNGPFRVAQYPLRAPGANEVLVRIRMSTICRSDMCDAPLAVGDRITWSEYFVTGRSRLRELADLPQKSPGLEKYGHLSAETPPHHHGGFGEFCFIQPDSWILKLPAVLSDEEATPINCGVAALAKARGAARVIGIEPVASRRDLARRFEVDLALDASAAAAAASGADVVIEE